MRIIPVLAVLALAATGCSSSGSKAPSRQASAPNVAAVTAAAATQPAVKQAKDAAAVIAVLKAAGLPIGTVSAYTAANDPNHLLGRPNGYKSKVSFTDTRIDPKQARDNKPGSVDLGGSVEVFSDASAATARASYIHKTEAAMPMLGTEYDYTAGPILLRLSQVRTPDQAAAYQKALG